MGCQKGLVTFAAFLLAGSVALLTASAVATAWLQHDTIYTGLWRHCEDDNTTVKCKVRAELFAFSSKNLGYRLFDIVLVLVIIGAGLSLIALVSTLIPLCQKRPSRCGLLIITILAFFGGAAGLGAVIYWEWEKIKKEDLAFETRGWATFATYVGGGVGVLASLFLSISICCGRKSSDVKVTIPPYDYNPNTLEMKNAYSGYPNVGYTGTQTRY